MTKKIFGFFMIVSILVLGGLLSWYFWKWEPSNLNQIVEGIPNVPENPEGENENNSSENGNATEENEPYSYSQDVYSVHLCDRYTDGTFAIRNINS